MSLWSLRGDFCAAATEKGNRLAGFEQALEAANQGWPAY
jgi:hypothetical protein